MGVESGDRRASPSAKKLGVDVPSDWLRLHAYFVVTIPDIIETGALKI